MPTFTPTIEYADGTTLTQTQLTDLVNSISTFLNTTKLDSNNIQNGGIATANYAASSVDSSALGSAAVTAAKIATNAVLGSNLNSNVVDNSTLQYATSQISIKDLGVTTAKIADLNVTTGKLADLTVTAAKMANSTITGTQVASNINLPGKTVQENGNNVIVSNTNAASNSLAVIRALVSSTGTISSGEGISVNHAAQGQFNITFSTSFGDTPAVVVSCILPMVIYTISVSTSGVNVRILDPNNAFSAFDAGFNIIAIGQRA